MYTHKATLMKKLLLSTFLLIFATANSIAQEFYADSLNQMHFSPDADQEVMEQLRALHYYVDPKEGKEALAEMEQAPEIYFDKVYYAPDSLIRIYRYTWETCGAYCNTNEVILLAYHDSLKNLLHFSPLFRNFRGQIDTIHKVETGKYLILGSYGARTRSIETINCLSATLFALSHSPNEHWCFDICTSNLVTIDREICSLTYKPETKEISYRYKYYNWDRLDLFYTKTGTWFYLDGTYCIQEEKTVYSKE